MKISQSPSSKNNHPEKPAQYKAVQLVQPRKIEYVSVDMPALDPNQILVKVKGSGICISDLPSWIGDGHEVTYPLPLGVPGHEGWGEIVEVGRAVGLFKVGQRVTFVNDRAFAEYTVVEEQHLLALPDELGCLPFPGQAFGSVLNVFQRAELQPGNTVAIIGQDIVARGLLQLCIQEDVRVIVLSDHERHLKEASSLTPHCFLLEDQDHLAAQIFDLTNGQCCDRVIECYGKQETLDLATKIAAEYAKVIVAGYHLGGYRQIDLECCYNKSLDIINAHEVSDENKKKGITLAAAAVLEGVLDSGRLLTTRYSFQDIGLAFENILSSNEIGKSYVIMDH